jgi:hypothetical protein
MNLTGFFGQKQRQLSLQNHITKQSLSSINTFFY